MKRFFSFVLLLSTIVLTASYTSNTFIKKEENAARKKSIKSNAVLIKNGSPWADSLMSTLSIEQKIGQLFMVAAYSNKGNDHKLALSKLVRNQEIGGLIFFQGGPLRQAKMCNHLQDLSNIPLMIGMDAEWGLSMRLDSTVSYPRQMTLGAIEDVNQIYTMGYHLGQQCRELGVHVNFAPVVDVNNNPANPVIGSRSFGEIKEEVAKRGIAYAKGMQDANTMACAKHFPGHGDTDTDSHLDLPVINHTRERLEELELYPFQRMFDAKVASVMVAHLYIPALDNTVNLASTLSPKIVTTLLRDEMGFEGLAFTDALNMNGVSKFFEPGEVDVKALIAGNDVLLFAEDVPKAIELIKQAIQKGDITEIEVNEHCHKILRHKEWLGLDNYKPIETKNLYRRLNLPHYEAHNSLLRASALTLVKDDGSKIPLESSFDKKTVILAINASNKTAFTKELQGKYPNAEQWSIPGILTDKQKLEYQKKVANLETLIITVTNTRNSPKSNFGVSHENIRFINSLVDKVTTILVHFGNPYALERVWMDKMKAVIVGYQDDEETQRFAAQGILGKRNLTGKLPVSINYKYKAGQGQSKLALNGLTYVTPEEVGVTSRNLYKIDSIIEQAITEHVIPGCQVLAARNGKIFLDKNYGYHTYEKRQKVTEESIYDLASVTKILSTTAALMMLYDQDKINIHKPIGNYISWLPNRSKFSKIKIKDALLHQAGLVAWIPYYDEFLKNKEWAGRVYSSKKTSTHSIKVAKNFYVLNTFKDTIFDRILSSKLNKREYKYSDLGMYLMKELVEEVAQAPIDEVVQNYFYGPMRLSSMAFKPSTKFSLGRIVPTEYDAHFREQLVQGYVHDQGAALLGGVGGHAGLFANAYDVAAMMQMFLNGGVYQGRQYLKKETVELFTDRFEKYSKNRRGLGFDKPIIGEGGPTFSSISLKSFGHSGFTGTFTWADPDTGIVYVFLSNRIYPTAANKKLIQQNIRSRIQRILHESVINNGPVSKRL